MLCAAAGIHRQSAAERCTVRALLCACRSFDMEQYVGFPGMQAWLRKVDSWLVLDLHPMQSCVPRNC